MKNTLLRLIALAVLCTCSLATAAEWNFEVYLDKQKIGTHSFVLQGNTLTSTASFDVKFLFINAYRYRHQAVERWENHCLQQLDAHTEENKAVTDVHAGLQNGQLLIEKNTASKNSVATLERCVMTFAYWDPQMLMQSRLLNPQNAEYLDIVWQDQGMQTYMLRGQAVTARQYQLRGSLQGKPKLNITLWYDQGQWIGLKSVTPEGYNIYYNLI